MTIHVRNRYLHAPKGVYEQALSMCSGDLVDTGISLYLANSIQASSLGGSTSVLFSKEVWRAITGDKAPFTAVLESYADRYGSVVTPHEFHGVGSADNRVTLVSADHVKHLALQIRGLLGVNYKKSLVNIYGNFTRENFRVLEAVSRNQVQRDIRKYIIGNHESLYIPTTESVEEAKLVCGDDEVSWRCLAQIMAWEPVYEPNNTSYRLFDSVWSNTRKEVRQALFPNHIELDLHGAYLAIIAKICDDNNIEYKLVRESLNSRDPVEYIMDSVRTDFYNRKALHGIKQLPKLYGDYKANYLSILRENEGLRSHMEGFYPANTAFFSADTVFDPQVKRLSTIRSIRDVIKTAMYKELFGSGRLKLLEFLMFYLPKTQALAVYGSSFFKELADIEEQISAIAKYKGLTDAWGDVVSVNSGIKGVVKKVLPSHVVHTVCSSYELEVVHKAYQAASKRQDGRIVLHQHDGIAVVGTDDFITSLQASVNKQCVRLGIYSSLVRKNP